VRPVLISPHDGVTKISVMVVLMIAGEEMALHCQVDAPDQRKIPGK
jgi:hypothetical protein